MRNRAAEELSTGGVEVVMSSGGLDVLSMTGSEADILVYTISSIAHRMSRETLLQCEYADDINIVNTVCYEIMLK